MENLFDKYNKNKDNFNILILIVVILAGGFVFKGHYTNFLTDFGRELIFPEAMLDGKVLYKDILCIYFPLAYQINTICFKLLGVNISSLEYFGIINAIVFSVSLYKISREFIDENFSFIFTLTSAIAATFNGSLFNLILPYSTGLAYGVTAYMIAVLFGIKYIKSLNIKYLYFAFASAGFAFACKAEFSFLLIILLILPFYINSIKVKNLFYCIAIYSFSPVISLASLFIQGLKIPEIVSAANFMKVFFTTDSMLYHIGRTGGIFRLEDIFLYVQSIIALIVFLGISFLLYKYTSKSKAVIVSVLISAFLANSTNVSIHSVLLPIIVFCLLLIFYKKIRSNIAVLFLILSAIALNIRMFWSLIITLYGMFSVPLLVLSFMIIFLQYSFEFNEEKQRYFKKFVIYITCSYLVFFTGFSIYKYRQNNTKVATDKGTFYIQKQQADTINAAIKYITQYTNKQQKILILPEGSVLNFLTDRKCNMHLHMADRLYYEALGKDYIINNIRKSDYEIIFIIKGYGLTNFGKPYLYDNNNPVSKYLGNNYQLDWETKFISKRLENTIKCYVKPYI